MEIKSIMVNLEPNNSSNIFHSFAIVLQFSKTISVINFVKIN